MESYHKSHTLKIREILERNPTSQLARAEQIGETIKGPVTLGVRPLADHS